MTKKTYIKAISYYLPEDVLTTDELIRAFPEWTVEKVASKIGVKERHIASKEQTALDLGQKAAEKLIEEHKIDKSTIDFVLLCTQNPDYILPASACILQDRLGLSKKCGALDFNLGCSGFIYGLSLAKGLIAANIAQNVLLINSEILSRFIHPRDKGNLTIFGDAAAATLITTDGFAEVGEFCLGTDGSMFDDIILKNGGARNKMGSGSILFDEVEKTFSDDNLFMNGTGVFNFTLREVPPLLDEVLYKNHKTIDDIDLFVFHQANKFMLEFLRKKVKIPANKFYYYIENVGNTASVSIPIALKEAQKDNLLKGDILLAGFGVGYSWGGVTLYCKNEK